MTNVLTWQVGEQGVSVDDDTEMSANSTETKSINMGGSLKV